MDIRRGEVTGEEFLLVEIDHDLHVLPSVGVRQDRTGDCDEEGTDSHNGEVIEFRRGQRLGRNLQGGHRYLRGEQPHDHRRVNIRRQRLDGRLRNRCDIGFAATQVDAIL